MAIVDRGKSWQINIHVSETERIRKNYKKERFSYEDVQRIHDGLMREQCRKHSIPGNTVGEIYLSYLRHATNTLAPRTVSDQTIMIEKHLLPFFANMPIDGISGLVLDSYIEKRKAEIQSKSATRNGIRAINLELLCLSALSKWACSKEVNLGNEPIIVTTIPCKRRLPVLWTIDELRRLFIQFNIRDKALGLCLYQGGLRKDETLGLTWDCVHFESSHLHIFGKGDKDRLVPMTTEMYFALWGFRTVMKPNPTNVVFQSRSTKKELTDWRKPLATAKKKSGVTKRIYPHLLRHCFGTYTFEATGDILTLSGTMGHEDVSTTQIYVKLQLERRRKMMREYEAHLKKESNGPFLISGNACG